MGSFCKNLQKLLEKMVIFRKIWNGTPNFTKTYRDKIKSRLFRAAFNLLGKAFV